MDNFDERYSRHFPLRSIGRSGQLKLQGRKVLVAGVGGLGTASSELLASVGVGFLRLVDFDVIEISNLPRQRLFTVDDVGKSKSEVAKEQLEERFPGLKCEARTERIDGINAISLVEGMDLIIDGLDRFSSRKALFRAARKLKIPYIFAGAVAEQGNIMVFDHSDKSPCLYCIMGDVGDDESTSCEILGVHPSILSLITSIQSFEATNLLLRQPSNLSDKMLYIDLSSMSFDTVSFQKKEGCILCDVENDELDTGKDGEITKGVRQIGEFGKALVTSLCGRDTRIVDPEWNINWQFPDVIKTIGGHYHIAVSGEKYITFTIEGVGFSLLESGVATLRGAKSTKNAIEKVNKVFSIINGSSIQT